MKGSELEEALEQIYPENTVNQIMSCKVFSRALRGHFLVESALMTKLLEGVLPVDEDSDKETNTESSCERLSMMT